MARKQLGELKTFEDLPPTSMNFKDVADISKTGQWRTFRPILDAEKCINCLICWKYCPEPCIELGEEHPTIDYDFCKGCGICATECPKDAISLVLEIDAQCADDRAAGDGASAACDAK
jgi:2-oxoacid:acceptor oxidoreductase delta subunit (pyruvate/2-ketoisovalerate family)